MKIDSLSELVSIARLLDEREYRGKPPTSAEAIARYILRQSAKEEKKKEDEKKKKAEYKGPSVAQWVTFFALGSVPLSIGTAIILLKGLIYIQSLAHQLQ